MLLRHHGGGTDTEIRVSTESRPWRRKFSCRSSRDSNPRPFNHESGALTTELFPPLTALFALCWLEPRETADVSAHLPCTRPPYNHAPANRFIQSHTPRVHVCLAVTCICTFGRMTRIFCALLRWNEYRDERQHRKSTLVKKTWWFDPAGTRTRVLQ